MAIPPPHVFVNIDKAAMIDPYTLEVTFTWARCADAASLQADWMGATQADDGTWDVSFSLREMRKSPVEPTCTGPVEEQTRRIDLRTLLRADMTRGRLQLNEAPLYGYLKQLPALTVPFDLTR